MTVVDKIKAWKTDPVRFVQDNFDVEPDAWQLDVLMAFNKHPRLAMLASKGVGKTTILAWLCWYFLATKLHPKIAATSISADNLADGLWSEMSKWQQKSGFLKDTFEWTKTRIFQKDYPETWWMSARTWPKGASSEQQANTLAGLHADNIMFVIDESGGVPSSVMAAAEAALANDLGEDGHDAKLIQAGNPTHLSGPLYQAWGKDRHMWHITEINSDPDNPKRSPRVSKEWALKQIEAFGRDNPWVLINVFGRFPPSSSNVLIGVDDVMEAMERKLNKDDYAHAQKRLGIDVARFGDDSTIIFPRQGLQAHKWVVMRNARNNEIASRILTAKYKWNSEVEYIDGTGGFGAGVVDNLIQKGHSPQEIHFSSKADDPKYYNKRAEMWFRMTEWIKRGGSLPKDEQLLKELTTPEYYFQNGRLILQPKEQIKADLGFSPDCFVAGTKISTPNGDVSIEDINEGDLVSTPYGSVKVIKKWISDADEICTVNFSNGYKLSGKGKHEIFTWNRGFVRLDALTSTDVLEFNSKLGRILWTIQNLLYTQDKHFSFKRLAATIPQGQISRKSFYIDMFGLGILEKYQRVMTFITSTMTGLIIELKTLRCCLGLNTQAFMQSTTCKTLIMLGEQGLALIEQEKQLNFGTQAKKVIYGTKNMGVKHGKVESHLAFSAQSVLRSMKHFLKERFFVQSLVNKKTTIKTDTRVKYQTVLGVIKSLFQINIVTKSVAADSVLIEKGKKISVYNLTLEYCNVYYANNILVSNCADALALTFADNERPTGLGELGILNRAEEARSSSYADYDPLDPKRF